MAVFRGLNVIYAIAILGARRLKNRRALRGIITSLGWVAVGAGATLAVMAATGIQRSSGTNVAAPSGGVSGGRTAAVSAVGQPSNTATDAATGAAPSGGAAAAVNTGGGSITGNAASPAKVAPPPAAAATTLGPLHAQGGKILDASGHEVRMTGINWFGLETGAFAPHGLWARNLDDMLDQMAATGFNCIRLPYSNQLFDANSKPNGIDYNKNRDLQGLSGLEIMDKVVEGAGRRGIRILLDRHRPSSEAQSELWYTDHVSEDRWIKDWVMLANRYRGNPAVIGADLHNEPHGPATWGDGNPKTDWRMAAEKAGNAILDADPDWLIVVEGIEQFNNKWYWWGGNLAGAKQNPVRLSHPDKLVYSAHDYGPGVSQQSWFKDASFPNNLPQLWHDTWQYLQQDGIAPVLVGEFGGRSVGQDTEGVWQRSLISYLQQNGISYTYWAWNPNSGDTGGILKDDWQTINQDKLGILSAYQWPLVPVAGSSGTKASSAR